MEGDSTIVDKDLKHSSGIFLRRAHRGGLLIIEVAQEAVVVVVVVVTIIRSLYSEDRVFGSRVGW